MNIGLLVGVTAFLGAAIAAAVVAYRKGRTVCAAAGLWSVRLPAATLVPIAAGALLVIAVVGAVPQPRSGSKWAARTKGPSTWTKR